MKKLISLVLAVLILISSAFVLASCKKEEKDNNSVVDMTSTTSTKAEKTIATENKTTISYTVAGGTDPYVEDIF